MNTATDARQTSRLDRGFLDPTLLVVLMATYQVAAWTLVPALTYSALPLDVVEGYMWGREWVIATYNHPALPSWVLEMSRLATGTVGWPAYLVSQLFTAATFVFVFLLGRELLGPQRAAAGTLLLTGIAFYAWPTIEFNHNVAQTPFWAALPWALWSAVQRRSIAWFALVGALSAGGVYAKLTTVLLLITLAFWMIWDRDARRCFATPGPWIGLAVFVALITPLALWLVAHDFALLKYAAWRSRLWGEPPHIFIANIFINIVGVLILLAIAGLIGTRVRTGVAGALQEPSPPPVADRAIAYVTVVTGGPLALTMLGAALSGTSLKVAWVGCMFNFAGILAIALTSRHFNTAVLRRIAVCSGVVMVSMSLGYAAVILAEPFRAGVPLRVNWPQAEICKRFVDLWTRETGQPLRIVGGDGWIAGLVGVTAADKPSLLSEDDFALSPWITPERLQREGALIVWLARAPRIPRLLQPLIATAPVREERFASKPPINGREIAIRYVIVLPKQRQN